MGKCMVCGKGIVWGYTPKNKNPHPFDARPTLVKTADKPPKVIWAYISHFVTCKSKTEKGNGKGQGQPAKGLPGNPDRHR